MAKAKAKVTLSLRDGKPIELTTAEIDILKPFKCFKYPDKRCSTTQCTVSLRDGRRFPVLHTVSEVESMIKEAKGRLRAPNKPKDEEAPTPE